MNMRRRYCGLRTSRKMLVSTLVFALPMLALLCYVVSGFNRGASFSQQEIRGMRVLEPLERLSELVPERQLLVRLTIEGTGGLDEKIRILDAKIDETFLCC